MHLRFRFRRIPRTATSGICTASCQLPAASDYDPRSSARCEEAWQQLGNFGANDVVVGVTDDGCQLDHPDFNSANKFAGWGYFEGSTLFRRGDTGARPSKMYETGSNHGTSCAGVIAAEVDAEATVGAAAGCRLAPIKWESDGSRLFISDSKLSAALRYLDSRVDIISNSWGGRPTTTWATTTKSLITRMSLTGGRRGKGVVFLWAAGNENCPVHHTSSQDVPFTNGIDRTGRLWVGVRTSKKFVNELVAIPGVLHIAALSSTAQRSHYSNYGTGIDLTAASSNSHEYHRLSLPGRGITTATGVSSVTSRFGGTSSATPLVAGVAALVISANPALSAAEVISLLKQTAFKDLNMQDWPKTPPASFDMDTSWDVSPVAPFDSGAFQNVGLPDGTWSPWFGHGNVDASAAVGRALDGSHSNVSASSSVNLVIPDVNPAGVASRVHIGDSGTIQDLQVSIDVSHTFIGVLVVALTSPSGRKVVLHDRSGGSNHNLAETYDETRTPSLASLAGESIQGVWTLEVTDFAKFDTGTFNSWRIDANVAQPSSIDKESAPGLAIPDNDPVGVSDMIRISDARSIGNIEVTVDITHTFIGDLIVHLENPGGTVITLHDHAGGGTDNLRRSYSPTNTPDLRAVAGQPSAGAWTLKVADVVGQDVGKLNRWSLNIS
jgi:subtilisin-like proprotein convertase family protein